MQSIFITYIQKGEGDFMKEVYKGLFIRDTLGDMGTIPSTTGAPTYSPDIICYQASILTPLDAEISYNKYICKPFLQDDVNNIYIRVKNNGDHAIAGKVKAFYSPITLLYTPKYWTPLTTIEGEEVLDVIDKSRNEAGIPAGEVGISKKAYFLDGVKEPTKHHCMMGIVSNEDGSFITLPEDFKNDNGLWEFLRNHPQIAYNNIEIIMPEKRVFSMPVQFGNFDDTPRNYIFNIEVLDGLESLEDAKIVVQSTNAENPFSFVQMIEKGVKKYGCEYTVKGRFFDYLDFSIVMPHYDTTKASLHIKNYAVNEDGDIMKPDIALDYVVDGEESKEETATQLGDFFLYIGEGLEHVEPVRYSMRESKELPVLKVTQRAQ